MITQLTDEQMAAAVVDGLAGVERCAICKDKPQQFACRETERDTGESVAFCSGCVAKVRKTRHAHLNTGQVSRLLRYVTFKGWLQEFIATPGKFNTQALLDEMLHEKGFRNRWRN